MSMKKRPMRPMRETKKQSKIPRSRKAGGTEMDGVPCDLVEVHVRPTFLADFFSAPIFLCSEVVPSTAPEVCWPQPQMVKAQGTSRLHQFRIPGAREFTGWIPSITAGCMPDIHQGFAAYIDTIVPKLVSKK